ncbi:hypothetical protein N0V83_007333 [Neocucurbitaria cava]|uniref:Heterokaryon incompatibility domain-containing protein n=1 Tax=Neocucurbitaria cava TaxID=798079 RepID=A0A9W8Y443_9PLEO|nr:hypothetical protein N0V83_007333 [Neocucurbitaria cava]
MRLLNVRTYQLKSELGKEKPQYAILSHTWEDDEVLFEDLKSTSEINWRAKKGFFKIKFACEQALKDGYDFIWIDTCCINKESSAELSEAINSMFTWYREASICYAYLSDAEHENMAMFSRCRWFGRGWTLQEMIAPDHVHFYDKHWVYLGSRISLATKIREATGIIEDILIRNHVDSGSTPTDHIPEGITTPYTCKHCGSTITESVHKTLGMVSIAKRMNWASKRATTRVEDIAYCLMGLFDVNMPLLYGEGEKAFFRLQETILKNSRDHSILAFRVNPSIGTIVRYDSALLAPHPSYFRDDIQREWKHADGHPKLILSEDPVEVAQYDIRDIERLRITICSDQVSDFSDSSLGIPLRFNAFSAGGHDLYTVGTASPALVGDYVPTIEQNTVGIISFYSHQFENFFIAWGHFVTSSDEKRWCRIWTLSQVLNVLNLGSAPHDDDAVEEIVQAVERGGQTSILLQPNRTNMFDEDVMFIESTGLSVLKVKVKMSEPAKLPSPRLTITVDLALAPRHLNTTTNPNSFNSHSVPYEQLGLLFTRIMTKGINTLEHIAGWLNDLDITDGDEDESESDGSKTQDKRHTPNAPQRQPYVGEICDEISPTNTSFSGTSIFDSPLRKYSRLEHAAPSSEHIDDDDDTSDATSVDEEAWEQNEKNKHVEDVQHTHSNVAHANGASSTNSSLNTTSVLDPNPLTPLETPHNPNNVPRTVWLASCLQCTLSNLPCSRTPPSCTRCARKGQAELCLLQRRLFAEEILRVGCTYRVPVLLKMKGESEEVWKRKGEVASEWFAKWRHEQDRRNWVLPDVCGRRGGYPVIGRGVGRVEHPGEGKGQIVHAELIVEMET